MATLSLPILNSGCMWDSQCFLPLSFHFLWLLHLESNFQKCVEKNQLLASTITDTLKLQGGKCHSLPQTLQPKPSLAPWHRFPQLSKPIWGMRSEHGLQKLPSLLV